MTSCVNVNRTAIDALGEQGLIERRNPHDVANAADAVIVMVRDEKQTDAVLDGDNGALTAMAPGSVLMLMSTLSPGY